MISVSMILVLLVKKLYKIILQYSIFQFGIMHDMEKPKDLRNLTLQERKTFLESFDIIMTDCDGVLWLSDTPINGALETLKMFQWLGKKIVFVSNNTTRSVDDYIKKLRKMGFDATPDQIINPALSIVWYLKKIGFKRKAFTIAAQSFIKVLVDNGIDVITGPNSVEEDIIVVQNVLSNPLKIGAVIMDFDINLNIMKMAQVEALLDQKDILFLVGTRDNRVPITKTRTMLGPGPFVDVLVNSTGHEPVEYAKPSVVLKDYIFSRYAITHPERCIFVGDSLATDMKFAELCGFTKLWVHSGVDQIDSIDDTSTIPDYYLPNLGTMPSFID